MALKVNTREDWACPPTTVENLDPAGVQGVAWHYPGGYSYRYDGHDICLRTVRSWDQMHRNRGWRMLGYNGLICWHGYFIEGRSRWNHFLNRSAANGSVAANLAHLGFQFMWGPKDGPVPDHMYRMAGEVTARARAQGAGNRITGHRDHYATECPGDDIYRNLAVIGRYATSTPQPTPPPLHDAEDDMMLFTAKDRPWYAMSGSVVVTVPGDEDPRQLEAAFGPLRTFSPEMCDRLRQGFWSLQRPQPEEPTTPKA